MKETVNVNGIAKGGPYSHAVVVDDLIFVSGQTGQVQGKETNFTEQFENAMKKISAILKECGSSLEKCVKFCVYMARSEEFQKMNELFGKYFPQNPPARTTLVAGFVLPEILVEIDIIASK